MGNLKTSCPTWLMRSPKKILLPSSPNWLTQKMKMVSSHTLHSSTDCAARHNLVTNQINLITKKKIRIKINQNYQSAKCHSERFDKIFFSIWQTIKKLKPKKIEYHLRSMSKRKSLIIILTWTFMKQQKILIWIWTDTFNEELSPNCC